MKQPLNYFPQKAVTPKEAKKISNGIKLPNKYTPQFIKIKEILDKSKV